jgi:DNA-3-methyladenine glycosylase II
MDNVRKAILHLKKSDPTIAAIIEKVGPYRMAYDEPQFHGLAEAIVYQQLSGKAAATIFKRLTDLTGIPMTPEGVLRLSERQMRDAGLSRQKLAYVRDLAEKTKSGKIEFSRLPALSDDEVIQKLTQVKGIGLWTAHMFLMFALRRLDVLPIGDLGIQAAMRKYYRKRRMPNPAEMEKIATCWSPYRTVACWYLWQILDMKAT